MTSIKPYGVAATLRYFGMHKHIIISNIKYLYSPAEPRFLKSRQIAQICFPLLDRRTRHRPIQLQPSAKLEAEFRAKLEALEALEEGDTHSAANAHRVVAALGEQIGAALGGEEHRQH